MKMKLIDKKRRVKMKYQLKLKVDGYDIIPFYGGFIICLLALLFLLRSISWTIELATFIALDVFALSFLVFCYSIQTNEVEN